MKNWLIVIGVLLCNVSCTEESTKQDYKEISSNSRVVSLSGDISEILCALGKEDIIVGVDVTSTFPATVGDKPNVGHISQLSIEGVLSLEPTVIIGYKGELNQEDIDQFRILDIQVNLLNKPILISEGEKLIQEIGLCVASQEAADSLVDVVYTEINDFNPLVTDKKVLFIYARGLGTLMVAGTGTVQNEMILGVGAKNAVSHEGFKTLTAESLVAANPDVILMFESGYESLASGNQLMEIPGIAETNAGINSAFITMEGSLLSHIGPRVCESLSVLKGKIENLDK
jgi:iron complex transport system substrate-binding protein